MKGFGATLPSGGTGKVKWTRIGMMLDATSVYKPLLGLQPSSDGGLMISPSYLPKSSWRYGLVQSPSGAYMGLGGGRFKDVVATPPGVVPKLHYHRSGYLSVNLSGHDLPRRGIRGVPLDRMRGAQCFSALITNPAGAESTPADRYGDLFYVPHGEPPTHIAVHGFIYGREQVPDLDRISPGPIGFVENHNVESVVDLAFYGIDAVLAIRFQANREPVGHDRTEAALFGFDYRATLEDTLADSVGMWNSPELPPVVIMRPSEAPFATIAYPRRSRGLTGRQRKPGEAPSAEVGYQWADGSYRAQPIDEPPVDREGSR